MISITHLIWIPVGAVVGFLASFIGSDLLILPVDLYYLVYFAVIIGFFTFYAKKTDLHWRTWFSRRLAWGLILGIGVGAVMVQNVLSRPQTEQFSGGFLVWAVFWRGLVYGSVDGLLLFTFPWMVIWRALNAEEKGIGGKIGTAVLAWLGILIVTTAYHLGYADFRSTKIVQPNVGSTIMSVPTLVTANPVASPIAHVFLHVTAVIHSPHTDLFLPPHRP